MFKYNGTRKGDVKMQYSLKELRARKNWTQRQTAAKLGVSVQTYNAWEKDVSRVAVGKVIAIADLFGVKLSEIKVYNNRED